MVRDTPGSSVRSLTIYQPNSHVIYEEDLLQTCAGSVFAISVSVSLYDPRLVDSVCHVLLVSTSSDSYSVPFHSSIGFRWVGPKRDLKFRLSLHNVWLWVSIAIPICSGGSLSDYD